MRKGSALLLQAALSGLILATGACSNQSTQSNSEERRGMGAGAGHSSMEKGECHGVNSCKGKGDCGGAGYSCAGKNSCKGQGWLKTTLDECDERGGDWRE